MTYGGKREGAGNRPIYSEKMILMSVRVTLEQREKFKALGGNKWLREVIENTQLHNK